MEPQQRHCYARWLERGFNGCMDWAARYCDVRDNPQLLLDGARSVIMLALNYFPHRLQPARAPQFAYYAYGRDYHEVMRERMRLLAAFIAQSTGETTRCCVDTAPLRERYWAQQAGIGFIGMNNQLIIPGKGSYFFLGAIITTLALPADEPCRLTCGECRACLKTCPAHALSEDAAVDARRCLSCLTIEQRGPLPSWVVPVMGNRVYGCDACQQCCPHNRAAQPTSVVDFAPSTDFLNLTITDLCDLSPERFRSLFAHSAVKRTRVEGLRRNASLLAANLGTTKPH